MADQQASIDARVSAGNATSLGVKGQAALARNTASVAITGTTNLAPFCPALGLAVLSIQSFDPADPNVEARFDAVATRNVDRFSAAHNSDQGSIEMLGIELSNAKVQVGDISSRHTDYNTQLQGMLGTIEKSNDNEVAVSISALQTRLQATYQTTSLISKLSLVNYLK